MKAEFEDITEPDYLLEILLKDIESIYPIKKIQIWFGIINITLTNDSIIGLTITDTTIILGRPYDTLGDIAIPITDYTHIKDHI